MATQKITDQNFDEEVLNDNKIVLVDFWAPWCGPCKIIAPSLEQISEEMSDKVKIVKLNVDENPEKAQAYQVLSIPNMKIFKDGQVVDELVGAMPKDAIKEKLQSQL